MPIQSINALDRRKYVPENDQIRTNGDGSTEQSILITDIISEGPIAGLVNGGSSIFLNNDNLMSEGESTYSPPEGMTVTLDSDETAVPVNTKGNIFTATLGNEGTRFLRIDKAYSSTVTLANLNTIINNNGFLGCQVDVTRTAGDAFLASFQASADEIALGVTQIANLVAVPVLTVASSGEIIEGKAASVNAGAGTATLQFSMPFGLGFVFNDADHNGSTTHTLEFDLFLEIASIANNVITLTQDPPISGTFDFSITSGQITTVVGTGKTQKQLDEKYENSGFHFNSGEMSQEALPTIEGEGSSSVALSAQTGDLEKGGSGKTITASGAQASEIDTLKILITYPSGLYYVSENSGRKYGTEVFYKIELSIDRGSGDNFQVLDGNSTFQGTKTFSHGSTHYKSPIEQAITFEIRIDLTKYQPFNGFKVKLTRLTEHDFSVVGKGVEVGGSLTENSHYQHVTKGAITLALGVIKEKLSFPYTAVCNVSFSSKSFNSAPTRTYECQGLKVQVPSNYITREENDGQNALYKRNVSTGAVENSNQLWDGNFRSDKIYTDNPAWVFYDVLTHDRYGLGDFLRTTDIDKYSLYKIAKYCDELVPDGKGGTEPRFRANLYLTKATDAYKVLKDMATIFRGILYWSDANFFAVIDEPKEPVFTFSRSNIIEGEFSFETTGSKTRANQIIVTWNNPEADYKAEPIIVEDRENQIKTGRILSEKAVAFGCTSEGQAIRYGRWKLWTAINQTEMCNFATSINASFLAPGDIINIQNEADYNVPFSGRVNTCTSSAITLDRSIASHIAGGYTYTISVVLPKRTVLLNQDSATINVSGGGTASFSRGDQVTHATVGGAVVQLINAANIDLTRRQIESAVDSSGNLLNLQYAEETIIEERTLTTGSINTSDGKDTIPISSAFSVTPTNGDIWAIKEVPTSGGSSTASSYKQYKILNISEKGKAEYEITAVEYFAGKFDAVDKEFTTAIPDPLFPPEDTREVPAPPSVAVIRDPLPHEEGEELIVQWEAPPDIDNTGVDIYSHLAGFEITHTFGPVTGKPAIIKGIGAGTRAYRFNKVGDGLHVVSVQAVSRRGRKSKKTSVQLRVSDIFEGNHPKFKGLAKGAFCTHDVMMVGSGSQKGTVKFSSDSFVAAPFQDINAAKRNTTADPDTFSLLTTALTNANWQLKNVNNVPYGYLFMDFSALDASAPNANALKLIVNHRDTTTFQEPINYFYDGIKYIADPNSIWTSVGNVSVTQNSLKITGTGFNALKIPEVIKIGSNFAAKVGYVESNTVMYIDRPWKAASATGQALSVQELDIDYREDFLVTVVAYAANQNDPSGASGRYVLGGGSGGLSFLQITEDLNTIGRSVTLSADVPLIQYDAANAESAASDITLSMNAVGFRDAEFQITGTGFAGVSTSASDAEFADITASANKATFKIHDQSGGSPAIPYNSGALLDFTVTAREKLDPDNTSMQASSTISIGKVREGTQGASTAVIYLYAKSTNAPSVPSNIGGFPTVTVTLSGTGGGTITGLSSGSISNNQIAGTGWYTVPQALSGTEKAWVVAATANGTGTTDTIASGEWSDVVQFSGADGLNSATVELFQLTNSTSAPADPSGALTYTFADGLITNSGNLNSWTQTATSPTSTNKYLWKITAAAIANTATDSIATSDWSTAILAAQFGAEGAEGKRTIQGYLYYEKTGTNHATVNPGTPGVNSYSFTSGQITAGGSGATAVVADSGGTNDTNKWTNAPRTQDPTVASTHYTVRYYGTESVAGASTISVSYSGIVQHTNFTGVVTFNSGTGIFSSGGTLVTSIDGSNIKTGSINNQTYQDTSGASGVRLNLDAIIDGSGNAGAVLEAKTGGATKVAINADGTAQFAGQVVGELAIGATSGDKITVGANDNIIIDGNARLITIAEDNGTVRVKLGDL